MRLVVQRVSSARVSVDGGEVGGIGLGLLILAGVEAGDTEAEVSAAASKVAGLRIFPDEAGAMNRSVVEAGGAVLVVSQFTLLADSRRGRRPSFIAAADPGIAEPLVAALCVALRAQGLEVASGIFGARMSVSLVNEGPVTLVLEFKEGRVV